MLHKPISTARKAEEQLTIMAREAEPKFLTAERKPSENLGLLYKGTTIYSGWDFGFLGREDVFPLDAEQLADTLLFVAGLAGFHQRIQNGPTGRRGGFGKIMDSKIIFRRRGAEALIFTICYRHARTQQEDAGTSHEEPSVTRFRWDLQRLFALVVNCEHAPALFLFVSIFFTQSPPKKTCTH
jgi:hypothetical protein